MGAIRGILFVFVCILIFLTILVGGILWTVSSSLEYEQVQPGLSSLVDKVIDEQVGAIGGLGIEEELDDLMPEIELFCETNPEYIFDYEGNSITIPCDVLVQGPAAVVSQGVSSLIEGYYYEEYDCDFWNCFGEGEIPLFLVSQKAQDYWQGKFYLVLMAFFVLFILAFLLAQKKANFFIVTGILAIVAALPLLKIGVLISKLANSMGDLGEYVSEMILIFFNQSNNVFIKIMIFGGALLIVGIVFKIFHLGFAIAKFFEKFSKKSFKTSKIGKEKKPGKVKDKEKKKK